VGVCNRCNIPKSSLEFFRNGKTTIPQPLFEKLISQLRKKEQSKIRKQVSFKDANWGRRKGGETTRRKHPQILKTGRDIARRERKSQQYRFPMNIELTEEIAEIIGAFIGDGFTNKYNRTGMTQFTGDAKLDYQYITQHLVRLLKKISPEVSPRIRKKENTIRLTVYSIELYHLFTERFKFPAGKKTYTVVIPKEILKAKKNIVNACLRGIFDTDGGIIIDKRPSYKEPYIRIHLRMMSSKLVTQIHQILQEQGINARISDDKTRIQINGVKECQKFIKRIGFSNLRHSKKSRTTLVSSRSGVQISPKA
jgi:intein/homing endonuclease